MRSLSIYTPQASSFPAPRLRPPLISRSTWIVIITVCALSGVPISSGSDAQLFLGDILLGPAACLMLWVAYRDEYVRHKLWVCMIPLLFTLAAVALDLFDRTDMGYLVRGIGRNGIFWAAFTVAFVVTYIRGYNSSITLWILAIGSSGVFDLLSVSRGEDLYESTRNRLALGIGIIVIAATPKFFAWTLIKTLLMVLLGYIMLTFLDVRFAGISLYVAAISGLVIRLSAGRKFWVGFTFSLGALLLTVGLIWATYSGLIEDTIWLRRQESNNERMAMLETAWSGFLTSPWTGHGTWSHALTFISSPEFGASHLVGVHNMHLQLAHEYGVTGLAFACALTLAGAMGATRYAFSTGFIEQRGTCRELLVIFCWIFTLIGSLLGPFNNFQRISWGLAFGGVIALAYPIAIRRLRR